MLTSEEVRKVAQLSRIELSEEEVERLAKDLSKVLAYVDELKAVDTEGLEIVSSVTGLENIMRFDEPTATENREKIMANAPETKDGYYKVRSIL